MKKFVTSFGILVFLFLSSTTSFAHVTIKPNQVGTAVFQTFTVGVPVEKDIPTVGLRLEIPEGLKSVTPNVKQGWNVVVKKTEGENPRVTEIEWIGGTIPAGQRDEFLFSAQAPGSESNLIWKAYQTYSDGSVVSWNHDPEEHEKGGHDESASEDGPYSETKVVNDLVEVDEVKESKENSLPLFISLLALITSGVSLWATFRKK